MRIWSLHPHYLDAKGLVALWRETLLAQAVLLGRTKGYTRHPQLDRFRAAAFPARSVAAYLRPIVDEATKRGYRFDATRIADNPDSAPLTVTRGQMEFERRHLLSKLAVRDPDRFRQLTRHRSMLPHPLFDIIPGDVEPWEKAYPAASPTPPLAQ